VALLIGFENNSRKALKTLESWSDEDVFHLPDEAQKGDRVLWYVGGVLQSFVAIGSTKSEWHARRDGARQGHQRTEWMDTTKPRRLAPFVLGDEVSEVCGLIKPRTSGVVPKHLEKRVLGFLQGKPIDPVERAVEGAATESRSRRRNPKLREEAIAQANNRCECCGTDFSTVARGLGTRCLVVHHKKQLKDYDEPKETKLSDLAVVCANCHMMIHADWNKALSPTQLRRKLK
jgi:hypothetical protein